MTFYLVSIAIAAALSAGLAWLMKIWKIGPFLEEDMPSTDNTTTVVLEQAQTPATASSTPEQVLITNQGQTSPTEPVDLIKACALAQQAFEGWFLPGSTHNGVLYPEGSTSYQNNNPMNIKGFNGKFLVFKDYNAGLAYGENYIRNVCLGKNPNYPKGCSIEQYTHIFTGDPEPAPTNYAAAISRGTGLSTASPMSALLPKVA